MSDQMEIVLGPPGTGKTTTLLGYIEDELASGTDPDRIAYLSFTRKATEEAISRACAKFNKTRKDFPYFRTLHSLCFMMLGLANADVMEGKRLQEFAAYAGVIINGRWSDDGSLQGFGTGDRVIFMENLSRVRGISLESQYHEDSDDLPWREVYRVARALREFKEDRGIMDYTDMLLRFIEAPTRPKLDVLIVDEVQDLSWAQWCVVSELSEGCRRVVVAGDDDQAIYRWAGADIDTFLSMPGDSRVLGQSWRVPRKIQEIAALPLKYVKNRRDKQWNPREVDGTVGRVSQFHQADRSGDDVLILARNDYVLREQVEPELRRNGVIYEKHGFPSVKASTMEAITLWERLRAGNTITGAEARRVYEKMTSGTTVARGKKTLPGIGDEDFVDMRRLIQSGGLLTEAIWHEALDKISLEDRAYMLRARRSGEKLTARPRVRISTIHGSKGGEANHVILMLEMAARTHLEMNRTGAGVEDEARVWYVGVTRARERLTIVDTRSTRKCPWL